MVRAQHSPFVPERSFPFKAIQQVQSKPFNHQCKRLFPLPLYCQEVMVSSVNQDSHHKLERNDGPASPTKKSVSTGYCALLFRLVRGPLKIQDAI